MSWLRPPLFGFLLLICGLASQEFVKGQCIQPTPAKDVTVIGGGLSGIFAASVLELRGLSYNLIEADDVWGGRLRSFQSDFPRDPTQPHDIFNNPNVTLEAGAQYMYGTKSPSEQRENPIHRLFREFGLDFASYDGQNWDTYDAQGSPIDPDIVTDFQEEMIKSVEKCLNKPGEAWFRMFRKGRSSPDKSAEELLRDCKGRFAWEVDNPTDLEAAMSHFYVEVENALPLSEFGLASFPEDSFDAFSEDLFTQFGQVGSSSMLQNLVNVNLDSNNLFLDTRVTSVDQTVLSSGILTTAEDSSGDCLEFESEYVIVTAPINILRGNEASNLIDFEPGLAIDSHPIEMNEVSSVVSYEASMSYTDKFGR